MQSKLSLLFLSLFLMVLVACGEATTANQSPPPSVSTPGQPVVTTVVTLNGGYLDMIKQRGRLIVGMQSDVPLFGFRNPNAGQVEGFDADIAHELARTLLGDPNKLELVETIGTNRIPFLQTDKVDLVISTMTITDERRQQVDFSDVYYMAGQSLLVRKGSPIKNLTDLAGHSACTTQASTSEQNIRRLAPTVTLKLFSGFNECLLALDTGQVDALTTDDIILFGFKLQAPNKYDLAGGQFSSEPYGVALKKGRPELLAFVNGALTNIKADGRWKASYDKWIKPATGQSADPPH